MVKVCLATGAQKAADLPSVFRAFCLGRWLPATVLSALHGAPPLLLPPYWSQQWVFRAL